MALVLVAAVAAFGAGYAIAGAGTEPTTAVEPPAAVETPSATVTGAPDGEANLPVLNVPTPTPTPTPIPTAVPTVVPGTVPTPAPTFTAPTG